MKNMIFRKAKESELETVYKMCEDIKIDYPFWDEYYPIFDNFLESYQEGGLYVAETDKEIVGSISVEVSEYNANSVTLSRFMVRPDKRRNGIGRFIFLKIEEIMKKQGFEYIDLLVRFDHPFALKMYESFGYQNLGKVETEWCDNVNEYYLLYTKKINESDIVKL